MSAEAWMALEGLMGLLLGIAVGYAVGWHRGALGLPLWRQRAKPKVKPEQQVEAMVERERKEAANRRQLVEAEVEKRFPHLTKTDRSHAVDEIMQKGKELRARLI